MKITVRAHSREIEAIELKEGVDAIYGSTPSGHYVMFIGDEAVIYAVAAFEGEGAYERALSGYEFLSVESLPVEDGSAFHGRFMQMKFRKFGTETKAAGPPNRGLDPAYASGRCQDGIARIFFLTREIGESREEFEARRQTFIGPLSQSGSLK